MDLSPNKGGRELLPMKALEERILREGRALPGDILLVDSFLNHGLDVALMREMARSWHDYFGREPITKVMTVEASGIAIAALTALEFGVPALFAKKFKTLNLTADRHQARVYSYTNEKEYTIAVSRRLLTEEDHVLLVDDFLANGCAMWGLVELVRSARASIAGIGIAIEKSFQKGGGLLREEGLTLCSLAKVEALEDGVITLARADA